MAKLGFVGLGVMGGNVVARLLEKGHTVTGYNRTKSKAQWLIDKGMKWADSPRAVCHASDVIFSMVSHSCARPGSRSVAARVREKGADMLDAPVSGSIITLQQGKLSIMAAGRRETFE